MAAAYLSFKQYGRLKQTNFDSKFWLYLAIILLLLSVNKQLDLQTFLTQTLKENAIAGGWYENRRALQVGFIVFLIGGLLAVLLSLRLLLAASWRHYRLAWLGILTLCVFILVRAASFHHVDILIRSQLLGVNINVILEIGSLLIIIVAALRQAPTGDRSAEPGGANLAASYLEIETEEDGVQCPNCATSAVSLPVHNRLYKCKKCGHKYTLYIANPS